MAMSVLYMQTDVSETYGELSELSNVVKVPVVLAAEMIQWYHISELPSNIKDSLPEEVEFISVLKDYDELKSAAKRAKEIPFVIPHSKEIFHEDNMELTDEEKEYLQDNGGFIKEMDIKGWVKNIRARDNKRDVAGDLYITKDRIEPDLLKDIIEKIKLIDVSIGFWSFFDSNGGELNGQSYTFKQTGMTFGHLAGLPNDRGKCTTDKCGINKDSLIIPKEIKKETKVKEKDISAHIIGFADIGSKMKIDDQTKSQPTDQKSQPIIPKYESNHNKNKTLDLRIESIMDEAELKQMIVDLQKANDDLKTELSNTKVSELDATIKKKDDELKMVMAIADKQKQQIEDLTKQNDILKTEPERQNLIAEIAKVGLDGYGKEELKDCTICQLKEKKALMDGLIAKLSIANDKAVEAFGLPKPSEDDKKTGNPNEKEAEYPSMDIDMNSIRKKGEDK